MRSRFDALTTLFCTSLVLAIAGAPPVTADEVTDTIDEARTQYDEGRLREAAETLDYAAQMVRQQRSTALEGFLPEPLEDWTAKSATAQAVTPMMMGGMTSAERAYHKGDARVTVSISADSPMMQGMMMMFSNPMFAGAQGAKLERIKGQKAMVTYNPTTREGNIKITVDNRMLVQVEGSSVTREDLLGYAKAVDYTALRQY